MNHYNLQVEDMTVPLKPVLVLYFNRPDLLQMLCQDLLKGGISNIYFAGDGPRNQDDLVKVISCRQIIANYFPNLNSKRHLIRDSNLGCRKAVSDSISWFFQKESAGIILEDDCHPDQSFFPIMSKLLDEYESDQEIFLINGSNCLPDSLIRAGSYRSIYPQVWGWASWKNRWEDYQLDYKDAEEVVDTILNLFGSELSKVYRYIFKMVWTSILNDAGVGKIDTWDYSLLATLWRTNRRALQIDGNLVVNIGFLQDGTHYSRRPSWAKTTFRIVQSLKEFAATDTHLDLWLTNHVYNCNSVGILRLALNKYRRRNVKVSL